MITENLHDQAFLDRYCIGFDDDHLPKGAPAGSSYRAYLEGKGPDHTVKDATWASHITGIPADRIRRLAREIATAKPCAITQDWGPQRHANGENSARAIFLLAAATGNIGMPGGGTGAREGSQAFDFALPFNTGITNIHSNKIFSVFSWLDAIDHGDQMDTFNSGVCKKAVPGVRANKVPIDEHGKPTNVKLTTPIKMVWQYSGNSLLGQTGDNNRSAEILRDDSKCELVVVCDIQYTTSARYADYILPGTSTAEEDDIHPGENGGPMAYGIVSSQAIRPLYECRNIYDICVGLAKRLGTEKEFTGGLTRTQWLERTIAETRKDNPELPTYREWKKMGIFRKDMDPHVELAEFRKDPGSNPLDTPSGKIEIYSERLAAMSKVWTFGTFHNKLRGDDLTALPEYVATWEGPEEAKASKKYPFQVIGHHFKGRTHSSYGNVDWLVDAHPQTVWINTKDARTKGITNGDEVFVYNDRGTIRLPARVTNRITPGVLSVPQGAWYRPSDARDITPPNGANPNHPVDINGAVNTLTSLHPSPLAKGNAVHTTIADVEKA